NPTSGNAPLAVVFNSSASSDADGSIVSWSWNFGDGGQSTAQNPSHTFTNPGQYNVVLTVTDDDGATDTAQLTITVNEPPNQPPVAYIDTPQAGGTYRVNQAVNYSGHATDPEDGNLGSSSFRWSVVLPNGRVYSLSSGTSSGVGIPVYTGVHELILSVQDSDGLQDEARITFNVTSSFGKTSSFAPQEQNAQLWGEVPSTTTLFNPYPNPFNPETTIQFELGKAERVDVRIYNVIGLEVDQLIAGQILSPGRYTLKWRAVSKLGQSLPSGIYFVSLQAGEFYARHRLLYLK
ncbi:PKD domain-containing protein, partial [candidate division KSB1 bacterium]|nr:PKD domain-containing protein [candidate division KSB1 bacterium]